MQAAKGDISENFAGAEQRESNYVFTQGKMSSKTYIVHSEIIEYC